MRIAKVASFITHATLAGLAGAFVLLAFFPELLTPGAVLETAPSPPGLAARRDLNSPGVGTGRVSYASAVNQAAPAVVNIYTARRVGARPSPLLTDPFFRRFFGEALTTPREHTDSSLGSGVIVSNQGYILTNNHLIRGADEIQVQLQDSRASTAQVVGVDPETDLAVLKIDLPDLPTVTISESGSLRVGDIVLAIGNPFGVGQTVTLGIVSATGRYGLGLSAIEDFIQTDAAINPGNSGGALIDAHGRLVGINTAIFSGDSQGIGFAIPADLARKVMQAIIKHRYVARGWLGVGIQSLTRELAIMASLPETGGVIINHVIPDSPADQAGLARGDIITHVNGRPVPDERIAVKIVADMGPGQEVTLNIVRGGEMRKITATVAERPPIRRRR